MKAILERYLDFNHWANIQWMNSMIEQNIRDQKLESWMSHILNAQHVWLQRLKGEELKHGVFQSHQPAEWAALELDLYLESKNLLAKLDLVHNVHYHSTSGKAYTDTVLDIFLHFMDHSSYHRGQMAARYRELKLEPLKTNLIHWSRNQET